MTFLTRSRPRRPEIIHAAGNPGEFSKVRYPEKGQLQMLRNLALQPYPVSAGRTIRS
jgi:hypothetical protein